MIMGSIFGVLPVFSEEKKIFLREFLAGYYRLAPYFVSKLLIEIPFYILSPIILICVCYFMAGFQLTAAKFFICLGINILISNAGSVRCIEVCSNRVLKELTV